MPGGRHARDLGGGEVVQAIGLGATFGVVLLVMALLGDRVGLLLAERLRTTLADGPLATTTLDADPLESDPLDSDPLDSAPLNADPLDSDPLDSAPLDSAPLNADPLDSAPLDSDAIGGATLVVASGNALLASTDDAIDWEAWAADLDVDPLLDLGDVGSPLDVPTIAEDEPLAIALDEPVVDLPGDEVEVSLTEPVVDLPSDDATIGDDLDLPPLDPLHLLPAPDAPTDRDDTGAPEADATAEPTTDPTTDPTGADASASSDTPATPDGDITSETPDGDATDLDGALDLDPDGGWVLGDPLELDLDTDTWTFAPFTPDDLDLFTDPDVLRGADLPDDPDGWQKLRTALLQGALGLPGQVSADVPYWRQGILASPFQKVGGRLARDIALFAGVNSPFRTGNEYVDLVLEQGPVFASIYVPYVVPALRQNFASQIPNQIALSNVGTVAWDKYLCRQLATPGASLGDDLTYDACNGLNIAVTASGSTAALERLAGTPWPVIGSYIKPAVAQGIVQYACGRVISDTHNYGRGTRAAAGAGCTAYQVWEVYNAWRQFRDGDDDDSTPPTGQSPVPALPPGFGGDPNDPPPLLPPAEDPSWLNAYLLLRQDELLADGVLADTASEVFNNSVDDLAEVGLTPEQATTLLGGTHEPGVVGRAIPLPDVLAQQEAAWRDQLRTEGIEATSTSAVFNNREDQLVEQYGLDPAQASAILGVVHTDEVGVGLVGEPGTDTEPDTEPVADPGTDGVATSPDPTPLEDPGAVTDPVDVPADVEPGDSWVDDAGRVVCYVLCPIGAGLGWIIRQLGPAH